MAKEVISRCDKCGTSDDVQEFRITHGGDTKVVDLCPEHGGPVLEVFELGAEVAKTSTTRPKRRTDRHSVVAIEDYEKQN